MQYFRPAKGTKEDIIIARDEVQAAAFTNAGLVECDKAGKAIKTGEDTQSEE